MYKLKTTNSYDFKDQTRHNAVTTIQLDDDEGAYTPKPIELLYN